MRPGLQTTGYNPTIGSSRKRLRPASGNRLDRGSDQRDQPAQSSRRACRGVDALGWPPERVEDLGKSGACSVDRHGFRKLIAENGLGNAGLVVSLDASRLARNNREWHQLLELCSVFGVLIADSERLYDPRAYHGRLLLGWSGIMGEAELHQLQMRLRQG